MCCGSGVQRVSMENVLPTKCLTIVYLDWVTLAICFCKDETFFYKWIIVALVDELDCEGGLEGVV